MEKKNPTIFRTKPTCVTKVAEYQKPLTQLCIIKMS